MEKTYTKENGKLVETYNAPIRIPYDLKDLLSREGIALREAARLRVLIEKAMELEISVDSITK